MMILVGTFLSLMVCLIGAVYFVKQRSRVEDALRDRIIILEKQVSQLEAEKKNLQESSASREEEQARLLLHFENLANQILSTQSKKMTEQGEKAFGDLLGPLKERLKDFEKKVDDTYQNESRERFALKKEITSLAELNQKITTETTQLTLALKGDVKTQGNWGEVILEMILERAGLQEGVEYVTQARDMGLKSDEGRRFKPDVIVNLSDGKHLILDSKVTLTSYERYVNAADEISLEQAGKAFVQSIYQHIDGLGAKHYENLPQLQSPDFVLMFMPIEPALSLVSRLEPKLFDYAWEHKIVMVAPSMLLATLKTIAAFWKTDRQNKNAQEIAVAGGRLYDKFVLFLSDLEAIGKSLGMAQETYSSAMNKLKTGHGNLLARVENLKSLGAKATKQIDPKMLDEARTDLALAPALQEVK